MRIAPCWEIGPDGRCACLSGGSPGEECKKSNRNWGKHPRITWRGGASADVARVEEWHRTWPTANWAWVLDDHLVLDDDPRNGGLGPELFHEEWLELTGFALPAGTPVQATGGGGLHVVLRQPADREVRNGKLWHDGKPVKGIDVKGRGGYVIVEPSNHRTGGAYRWCGAAWEPAAPPAGLLPMLDKPRADPALNGHDELIIRDATGERFDPDAWLMGAVEVDTHQRGYLLRGVGSMRSRRVSRLEAITVAATVADRFTNTDPEDPWDLNYVARLVDSVYDLYPAGDLEQPTADQLAWARATADGVRFGGTVVRDRLVGAGDFVFDEPEQIPAVWGEGDRVLWAEGEGFMLAGHQGVGKTTLVQQLVLRRVGLLDGPLLGLPVTSSDRPLLYLAMDRPRQAARSMRRMVTAEQRVALNERVRIWRGPLPFNPTAKTALLADFVERICPDCDAVAVDSVKDLAPGISKDEVGAALNSAWQEVIARNLELVLNHHERKAEQGKQRHHTLDDVYGSTWLTSGLGSVVALDGEPGDPTVELRHLKQPAAPVDLRLRHDHATGTTGLYDGPTDVQAALATFGDEGATAEQLALAVYGRSEEADLKRIKRALDKLAGELVTKVPGGGGSGRGREPDRWRLSDTARFVDGLRDAV